MTYEMCDKKSRVLSEVELKQLLASREVVACVFENETQDQQWSVGNCQVIENGNGISFVLACPFSQLRLYTSLEEAVLREVVEHGLKVICVNTSRASKLRYFASDNVYLMTKSNANFFHDFMRPCGFDLLQAGVEVCELE